MAAYITVPRKTFNSNRCLK
ncbi:rCG37108 [Rattus norvegicus]|uniref:RCG37108 n=1 Tax=Rattus norvegicus TaxID=10116 RepID=A6HU50_RAT|nr:rCG37108 [Rattus norvegicus]